jgi:hypothetical protein
MHAMKTKKNLRKQVFNWHMWAGIAFAIPVFLVSLTAILIAHEDGIGTKQILVKAGWLPGYQAEKENISYFLNDAKAHFYDEKNQTIYYGTKVGLVKEVNGNLNIIKGTEGAEVRDILQLDSTLLIASKYSVLRYSTTSNTTVKLLKGDFHGLSFKGDTLIALAGKHGYFQSTNNGTSWSSPQKLSERLSPASFAGFTAQLGKSGIAEQVSWQKLILDIHTGEAFFGKESMWIWIDLIGLSLLLMVFTGIWMWYKRKFKKSKKRRTNKKSPQLKTVESI